MQLHTPSLQAEGDARASRWHLLPWLATLLLFPMTILPAQPPPAFFGTWTQSNERSVPKRSGEVVRHIEQNGPSLTVETTARRASGGPPRHALQRYTVGGPVSVSTGADGDEFHTSVVSKNQSLVFSIEEHEDGRIIHSTETWTLIDNGDALLVGRETLDAPSAKAPKQTIVYLRQSPALAAH